MIELYQEEEKFNLNLSDLKDLDLERRIEVFLISLEIGKSYRGMTYVQEALMVIYDNHENRYNLYINKDIYHEVSKRLKRRSINASSASVERGIRTYKTYVWKSPYNVELMNTIFRMNPEKIENIKNATFLYGIYEFMISKGIIEL